jgi:hypothetical protein
VDHLACLFKQQHTASFLLNQQPTEHSFLLCGSEFETPGSDYESSKFTKNIPLSVIRQDMNAKTIQNRWRSLMSEGLFLQIFCPMRKKRKNICQFFLHGHFVLPCCSCFVIHIKFSFNFPY